MDSFQVGDLVDVTTGTGPAMRARVVALSKYGRVQVSLLSLIPGTPEAQRVRWVRAYRVRPAFVIQEPARC